MKRTALILGASSDIGLSLCRRYLADGCGVIAHYRSMRPELAALMAENPALEGFQCDLTKLEDLERALADNPTFFTQADILVTLAADLRPVGLTTARAADMIQAISVGALANFLLMATIGPAMAARGWGRIVIGSSIGVTYGGGRQSFIYGLSKHTAEFLPRECRDWVAQGVLSNVVRIGVTDTRIHRNIPGKSLDNRVQMIPAGRAATPEEIAETLYWLGSEHNTYITGQTIAAAGGE